MKKMTKKIDILLRIVMGVFSVRKRNGKIEKNGRTHFRPGGWDLEETSNLPERTNSHKYIYVDLKKKGIVTF